MNLDYFAFVDELHKKGARPDCPICETNDWRGLGNLPEIDTLALIALSGAGRIDPAAGLYRVLGIVCGNCGFVRLHAREAIDYGPLTASEAEQPPH